MSTDHRVSLQPAWVLHRRPYRDTSEIADLLTKEHGRVAIVARGARATGRRRIVLEPFRPLFVSWSGRGELRTLVTAEARGEPASATGQSLLSMFYMNELLIRLLRKHDPHPETFYDYEGAVRALAAGTAAAPTLRYFECRLLSAMGYGLNLSVDVDGRPLEVGRTYEYLLEAGPVAVTSDRAQGIVVTGSSLLGLANESLEDPASLREIRRLLQAALALYLGDRPLKSRQVLLAMRERSRHG